MMYINNMRRCSKCQQIKPLVEFSFKNKKRKKLNFYCKECNRIYNRAHYIKNRLNYRIKQKIWRANFRKIIRLKIIEHFKTHPCVDCGEKDCSVLEFDHVKGDKKNNVASLIACDATWRIIEEEIDKCEVRCANCHKRRSAKQFGWYKYE